MSDCSSIERNDVSPDPVTQLVIECFPSLPTLAEGERCWVAEVIRKGLDGLPDLHEAVELARLHGQIDAVQHRLRQLHPLRKAHKRNHDRQVIDCLTEVSALGWAAVFTGGMPTFVSEATGSPDVYVPDPETWVEAKAVNPSWVMEPGVMYVGCVTPLEAGFWKKLDDHFSKAVKQLARQAGGEKVFFLNYMPDTDKMPLRDTEQLLIEWAKARMSDSQVGIVIVKNFAWRTPIVQMGVG